MNTFDRPTRTLRAHPIGSNGSRSMVGLAVLLTLQLFAVLVTAFPIQKARTPSSSAATTRPSSFRTSGTDRKRRTIDPLYSTTEDRVVVRYDQDVRVLANGETIGTKNVNGTVERWGDGAFSNEIVVEPQSPMQLSHTGTFLQLSSPGANINGDRQHQQQLPIRLLDGLSPDVWTAADPAISSSSTNLPASFSSLTLQTKIPSVAIESLVLGNFLAQPDSKPQLQPHKFLAASRLNRYWMGPKFGRAATDEDNDDHEIPVDTQFLMVEIEREISQESSPYYALLMPLVDGGFRSALESTSDSILDNDDKVADNSGHKLTLVSYSESGANLPPRDATTQTRNALYVAVHDEPFELLRLGFRQVSELLSSGGETGFRTLDQKEIPTDFVDSFGWCSWDAFYSKVHPSGILEGVRCLTEAGVPVKNVILDDGWQQVSPPYLHQPDETNGEKKATSSLAASLSLSGSSDIMTEDDSSDSLDSPGTKSPSLISSVASYIFRNPLETLSNIGGSIFGVVASGVTNCYQKYVENAPVKSLPKRMWTFLARHSPLNYGLWKFFDSETDFGRQLNDFSPNWKFLEETTPSEPEPEPERKPSTQSNGKSTTMALKELVSSLKHNWKVNRVYCWHSIHGYWRGVSNELGESIGIDVAQVKTRPSDHLLRIEPEMAFDPPSLFGVGLIGKKDGDLQKFYKHLHEPLVEAGVDGVKVDVQSGITAAGMCGDGFPNCPPLAKVYTQAMEESVTQRFPSTSSSGAVECINCMCHSTENLYRYKNTAVARASDDFYPARPESHSVHLVNVAYNSLFLGEICLPDWDMFHSKHESAELHAAARAIGGCSVYVSDAPGKHNVPLLKKLVLPDGSVLRAQQPGRPTRDCIFTDVGRDGTSALKIWNVNRASPKTSKSPTPSRSLSCGGVVGSFNVQGVAWNFDTNENEILDASPPAVKASIKPHDVDNLRQIAGPFAVWSHRTQSLQILPTGDSTIEIALKQREWEIHTVQSVQLSEDFTVEWAPIGLGKMLNSGGAVIDVGRIVETNVARKDGRNDLIEAHSQRNRLQADITTRGPGSFVSYCQPRPSCVLIRNGLATKQLDFEHDGESGLLEFELPPETIEGKAHYVTVVWE
mmetsp:Transcript_13249/g.37288  ORF Transcript_13249/g.37288 Transcript_13249/m.37288 type:complete len:1115 (+) Transcript_13249:192-3536(+)